ncbi:Fe(3+)-hydroxamate ABC transporter permease FhuB [Phyllobacterium sp. SB3]|uniref:Fe(3+)-hydroxamate ABC transporter permease FhuB n=1 Tax=Phyllobacterium sp. SB3 TaxID=3156073 RepID=UPI0032AFA2D2
MKAEPNVGTIGQSLSINQVISGILLILAAALCCLSLTRLLPPDQWSTLMNPERSDSVASIIFFESFLPRVIISLIAGAGLALAGVLFQSVLRNPLAEPATLGISAGAQLALVTMTLFRPELAGSLSAEGVASLGATIAILLILAIGWSANLSPARVIVVGIFISLYCGAASGVLVLFNQNYLTGVFLWSSGSLVQNGWDAAVTLSIRMALAAFVSLLLLRQLSLLSVGDENVRGLGGNLTAIRVGTIGLAVALSASIVSKVGMIAFIGLAAPAIARAGGARSVQAQYLAAPLIGAALLCSTDQLVQLAPFAREIPTGAATALLGGPLLLWLLPRLKATTVSSNDASTILMRNRYPYRYFLLGGIFIFGLIWLALAFGPTSTGWDWLSGDDFSSMLQWRWPRIVTAGTAGAMLAAAGVIMQRMTGNPLASPEILGISSGAALGLIVLLFIVTAPAPQWQFLATVAGASLTFLSIVIAGRQGGLGPHRLLLVGIAVGTTFSALAAVLMSSGDPRMTILLGWMAGSTYRATETGAVATAICGVALLLPIPYAMRGLEILPLGESVARSLGLPPDKARLLLLLLSASLTGLATLAVGPLTFVGLLAPHLSRLGGFSRAGQHLTSSILLGIALMIAADWLGRIAIFPYQIPAGLFSTFLAGPLFLFLQLRQKA